MSNYSRSVRLGETTPCVFFRQSTPYRTNLNRKTHTNFAVAAIDLDQRRVDSLARKVERIQSLFQTEKVIPVFRPISLAMQVKTLKTPFSTQRVGVESSSWVKVYLALAALLER